MPSLPDLPSYQDGNYSTPVVISTTPREYPFAANGDTASYVYTRRYLIEGEAYTRTAFGTVDPLEAGSYLVAESPLEWPPGRMATFTRTYAKIPANQVTYDSMVLTKPAPRKSAVFFVNKIRTLTYATTAGGTMVYSNHFFSIGASLYVNRIFGPLKTASASANSGANTRVTITGHGFNSSLDLVFRLLNDDGVNIALTGVDWAVVDANTIDILGINYGTIVVSAATYLRDYAPGTDRVRVKRTQRFYLPGVTPGITTPEDIPLPAPVLGDDAFLALILAHTSGYQAYDAEPLGQWMDSTIYQQTTLEIDMANL